MGTSRDKFHAYRRQYWLALCNADQAVDEKRRPACQRLTRVGVGGARLIAIVVQLLFEFTKHCLTRWRALRPRPSNSCFGIFLGALLSRRDLADGTNPDDRTVFKSRTLLSALNRFLLVRDSKKETPGDRFLRFRKRPVRDYALFPGNNFAFVF
jgi:hypothetical protein